MGVGGVNGIVGWGGGEGAVNRVGGGGSTLYAPPCILVQCPLCTPPALLHIQHMMYTVQLVLPAHEQVANYIDSPSPHIYSCTFTYTPKSILIHLHAYL